MSAINTPATESPVISTLPAAMDIRVNRAELRKALERAARATDRKSSMPALANVAIQATPGGEVTITGTNLNLSVIATLTNTFMGLPGGLTVNAKALLDLVKKLPDAEVGLKASARGGIPILVVGSGNISAMLDAKHLRDFPKIPDTLAMGWETVSALALAKLFGSVEHAICKDETRFHLNGVLVESDGTKTRMVTTDGHRLVRADAELALPRLVKGVIIPAPAVKEIGKLLGKSKDTCGVMFTPSHMFVRHDGATLATKMIDAQFPPYEQVIPKDYQRLLTVERAPLIAALERAKLVCTATRGVKLIVGDGKLVLASDNPDVGESRESITAEGTAAETGETSAIGVNAGYLLELLAQIDCKHVTIALDHKRGKRDMPDLSPILVRSTEHAVSYTMSDAPYLGVVMPMRI